MTFRWKRFRIPLWVRLLALIQIAAGLNGLALVIGDWLPALSETSPSYVASFFAAVFFGAVFLSCIVAGVLLWKDTVTGLRMSLILQVLQISEFSLGGVALAFRAGFRTGPMITAKMLYLGYDFDSQLFLFFNTDIIPHVNINVLAILFAISLFVRLRRHSKRSPGGPTSQSAAPQGNHAGAAARTQKELEG